MARRGDGGVSCFVHHRPLRYKPRFFFSGFERLDIHQHACHPPTLAQAAQLVFPIAYASLKTSRPRIRERERQVFSSSNLRRGCRFHPFSFAFISFIFNAAVNLFPFSPLRSRMGYSILASNTHLIRIQYQMPLLKPWAAWDLKTGTSVLNLVMSIPHNDNPNNRFFLRNINSSLALPYYCRSEPPIWAIELPSADMVHVLITALLDLWDPSDRLAW
jgi:hypothetical protein